MFLLISLLNFYEFECTFIQRRHQKSFHVLLENMINNQQAMQTWFFVKNSVWANENIQFSFEKSIYKSQACDHAKNIKTFGNTTVKWRFFLLSSGGNKKSIAWYIIIWIHNSVIHSTLQWELPVGIHHIDNINPEVIKTQQELSQVRI